MGAALTGGTVNGMVIGGSTRAAGSFTDLTSTNALSVDSDRRFKRNISDIESALDVVGQLSGVQYSFKTDEFPEKGFSAKKQFGFIAQDIEKVLPEVVTTSDDGFKAVAYSAVTPVLTNAVKELVQRQTQDRELINTLIRQRSEDRALIDMLVKQRREDRELIRALTEHR